MDHLRWQTFCYFVCFYRSNGYLHAPQIVSTTPIPPKDDGKKYGCLPCSLECKDTIAEMTDFSLFRDVIFVLFILSNFLTSIGYNLPYLYLPVSPCLSCWFCRFVEYDSWRVGGFFLSSFRGGG